MDDPRNIFVSQRQGYAQTQQPMPQTSATSPQQGAQSGEKQSPTVNPTGVNATGGKHFNQAEYEKRVAEMKSLAEKYQREGEGQLVKDILNTVIEQKAKGQLTNEQLVAFAKRITPMLNADQRQRLNQLVEQLIKL